MVSSGMCTDGQSAPEADLMDLCLRGGWEEAEHRHGSTVAGKRLAHEFGASITPPCERFAHEFGAALGFGHN